MIRIPSVTRREFYAVHEHLLTTLQRVPVDEENQHLHAFLRKMQSVAHRLICQNCGKASVHAQGRCEACYRFWRRNGEDKETQFGRTG